MQAPLISREIIYILKLVHGLFNLTVMLLLFYHARNGFLIRGARRGNKALPLQAIKRHRRMGPVLGLLGGGGFFAGLILVILDTGKILIYPPHLFTGIIIIILLLLSYSVSRTIAGSAPQPRDIHYRLGLAILALYVVNVFLGMVVLL